MDEKKIQEIIYLLESEQQEQKESYWMQPHKKYEALENYDNAIRALKEIAYLQFDLEIE